MRELIRQVTTMTKVSKEEMVLPIDWITGGISDLKNAWRHLLEEKAHLISTGEEDFEAPESDEEENTSAAESWRGPR